MSDAKGEPRVLGGASAYVQQDANCQVRRMSSLTEVTTIDSTGRGDAPSQSAFARQRSRIVLALCFALLAAPLVLMLESVVAVSWLVLDNVRRIEQCGGLRMDEGSIAYAVTAVLGSFATVVATAIVVVRTVPSYPRVPLLVSAGAAGVVSVVSCPVYARWVAETAATGLDTFRWGWTLVAAVWCLPCAQLAGQLAARGPKCTVVPFAILAGAILAMPIALFSAVVCLYIVLSNNLTGVVGLVINGKSRDSEFWRTCGADLASAPAKVWSTRSSSCATDGALSFCCAQSFRTTRATLLA
jgi:hypothetical protein